MRIKTELTVDDFISMEQLELKYYSEEHITPHEEAYHWHLANPNTGFVLEDDGRVVAFTDMLPVKQEIFEQIANGTFNDKYLTTEDILAIEELMEVDSVNLLLSCILVDDEYRETDALRTLLTAQMDYYRNFEEKGISFDSIITSNVTEAGVRFSERMGFDRIGKSHHQTTLFRTTFAKFDDRVRAMRPRLERQLLEYEMDLLDPEFCRDAGMLNVRIADGFMEYGTSGTVYGREETIRLLQAAGERKIEIQDFKIKCLARNVAEAHYVAVQKWETGGGKNPCSETKRSLRTSIWTREDELWRLLFHQGTAIK